MSGEKISGKINEKISQEIFKIVSNEKVANETFRLELSGETRNILRGGQFVNVKIDSKFLRRPIAACDYEYGDDENPGKLVIEYRLIGEGTELLSKKKAGEEVDILLALGNGYKWEHAGDKPMLIAGGLGAAPIFALAKDIRKNAPNAKVQVALGFEDVSDVILEKEFKALGVDLKIFTVNGTYGAKGFPTEYMKEVDYSYFYACGPMSMYKGVEEIAQSHGEYSFEERMGCGFGACMGCTCKTKDGNKRICKDGPVFTREEVIW